MKSTGSRSWCEDNNRAGRKIRGLDWCWVCRGGGGCGGGENGGGGWFGWYLGLGVAVTLGAFSRVPKNPLL